MKFILVCLFILVAGCSPSESHIRKEIGGALGIEGFTEKDTLDFKYTNAYSSNLYYSVYQVSKSDFFAFQEYLVNEKGFSKFEVSDNGFDVHHAFPEKKVWHHKTEYLEKTIDSNQQRYSVFYLIDSEVLIVEYFSSR